MSDRPDYATVFETLHLPLDETLGLDIGATMGVDALDWRDTMRASLPHLPLGSDESAQFRIAKVLGQGGMGVVHLAYQAALGRHVAIKTVIEGRSSREAENALLQEARIMGLVEHPNVVPVHIIGQDANGRPIIVMKRIDGTAWSEYLDKRVEPDSDDPLGFNLTVLLAVCRAVSLAHDRHILHRDLKPENVMIGRFGEVYVLDWGLAVTMAEDVPYVPSASDSDTVVGTPAYIAPEMTVGEGKLLGPHTDVFLLGAMLYHIITGEPPNRGESLFDVLAYSYEGRPRPYPADVSPELRDIAEKAMAHAPQDRFASADALREAVEGFLSHRNSHVLAETALQRLDELDSLDSEEIDEVHRVFGEARFGFMSALSIWPENPQALDGLNRCLRRMIELELEQENVKGARAVAAQLPEPDPDIEARINALQERLDAEAARLAKIAYDYDESVGFGTKRGIVGVMAVLFLIPPGIHRMVAGAAVPAWGTPLTNDIDTFVACIWALTFAPGIIGFVLRPPKKVANHKSSRIFAKGLLAMYTVGFGVRTMSLWADVALHHAMGAEAAVYGSSLMMLGLAIDRRLFTPGIVFVLAGLATAHFADHCCDIFCGGAFVACLTFIFYRPNLSAD